MDLSEAGADILVMTDKTPSKIGKEWLVLSFGNKQGSLHSKIISENIIKGSVWVAIY